MLEVLSPITEAHTFNNFTMKEKTPVVKINLRGNSNNKDFSSKVGKILGIILPSETGHVATKEKITVLSLGPNEWLIVSNDIITGNPFANAFVALTGSVSILSRHGCKFTYMGRLHRYDAPL